MIHTDPCGNTVIATPVQPMMEGPCGWGPVPGQMTIDGLIMEEPMMENIPTIDGLEAAAIDNGEFQSIDQPHNPNKAAFLKRFTNWLQTPNQTES